jgi:hypothetical protein
MGWFASFLLAFSFFFFLLLGRCWVPVWPEVGPGLPRSGRRGVGLNSARREMDGDLKSQPFVPGAVSREVAMNSALRDRLKTAVVAT